MAIKTPKWFSQVRETWKMTTPLDPAIRVIVPGVFVGVSAVFIIAGKALGTIGIVLSVTGPVWGLLAATYIFGRRAQRAAYASIEGQPGAAASVLNTLRAGWFTTPAIEVNRAQELVHRVVGRAGVVLVIEGRPGSQIAQAARQKTARWVGETPIHELFVGNGEGQVSLLNLNKKILKFPRVLRAAEVTDLRRKLDAAPGGALPIPKGPMPKGLRVPRR